MKIHVLYGVVVCVASIFTVLIFLDFRKQREAAETLRAIQDLPLSMRHLFIAPKQVKVENWQIGESSVYHLRTNMESEQISFHVAARDSRGSNRFWLRTNGLVQFNEMEIELWRLLDETNLRPGNETRAFFFLRNTIPVPTPPITFLPNPVVLEKLGDEIIETPVGSLKCEHSFAYVRSPNGEYEPLLELWTNPAVSPLGLVRARWQDASLDLVQVDTKTVPKIPPALLEEFDRNTPLDGLCIRCHTETIGEKDLKLESMTRLSGSALNLTSALFHLRQAEIVKPENLIHVQLIEKRRRTRRKALVRLSWGKGSFWVKPDKSGLLVFSLDAIAHDGNITVQPSTGRLRLEPQR